MREYDLIAKIIKELPQSNVQQNKFMSCDAEIIEFAGQLLALSIDEFSPEEDFFTDENPEMLGHNLVVATLSDLYAAGADPFVFMQALTLKKNVDASYLDKFTSGLKNALTKANCFLCGGDLSSANNWRFTGFAMGKIAGKKFLQRILPNEPQTLWVTGTLGDANFAILANKSTPKFELRNEEAQLIQQYATACIDTSSGLFDAIFCFSQQKPEQTIEIHLDQIPITNEINNFFITSTLPKEVILIGGAGEYELLFTTTNDIPTDIRKRFYELGITPIGSTYFDANTQGVLISTKLGKKRIQDLPPCPRNTTNLAEYFEQVYQYAKYLRSYE